MGSAKTGAIIKLRVHRIRSGKDELAASKEYAAGSMRAKRGSRVQLAIDLLTQTRGRRRSIIVAGTGYGANKMFVEELGDRDLPFVVHVRPSTSLRLGRTRESTAEKLLEDRRWHRLTTVMPDGGEVKCKAALLPNVRFGSAKARLFAAQIGGIDGVHRGTILALSSFEAPLAELVRLAAHAKWIRLENRRRARGDAPATRTEPLGTASKITARANITLARKQDARRESTGQTREPAGELRRLARPLNVVELFSGAGGMGLGFLFGGGPTRRYRITYSGDVNPIFVRTLQQNHESFERVMGLKTRKSTPRVIEPVDLRKKKVLEQATEVSDSAGGTHVLIGGPPCQGFSMANRNSWSGSNPNNELIEVFLKYVRRLQPRVFLMENVQGILWTPNGGSSVSVVDVVERRMRRAGYIVFPKLLDAVWYGVPQHRTRFFLLGLHRDLGYTEDCFGEWGPFPAPTHGNGSGDWVTVRDAISDLPRIGNGCTTDLTTYTEPRSPALRLNSFLEYVRAGAERKVISDHVTSKHADYVIERYRNIPAGGNWESIRDQMTNYADVSRTHSNIYRRIKWNEPSITIGHYRKSMLVHPKQHRGLSLREAARLQSFPDWFRFAGSTNSHSGGLVHKQQQLANAVCPLVTKAVAEYVLGL